MSDSTPKIDRFCVRCRSQISQKRVAGGSCFCSDECRARTESNVAEHEPTPTNSVGWAQRASAQKDSPL